MQRERLSDSLLEREFFKYVPSLASRPYEESNIPISSDDFVLTALAQLGTLRLQASRCLISLFNRSHQYILAEATPSLSLQSDEVHDMGDNLWFGSTIRHRHAGPCSLLVEERVKAYNEGIDYPDCVTVIRDLTEHESFQSTEFMSKSPAPRFYAAVPLQTSKGAIIGSYCVVDHKPRDGLSPTHIKFLQDIGTTVMSHLVLAKLKEEYRQGEKTIRGIGSFVEGKATLRSWRITTGNEVSYEPSRRRFGGEGQLDLHQQSLLTQPDTRQRGPPSIQPNVYDRESLNEGESITFPAASPTPDPHAPTITSEDSHSSSATARSPPLDLQGARGAVIDTAVPAQPQPIQLAFSRAANVIRECLEVEGAVFYNAGASSHDGISLDPTEDGNHAAGTSGDDTSQTIGSGSDNTSDVDKHLKSCSIIAHSESQSSSINLEMPRAALLQLSERFLKSLFRRYPKGQLFHFDADGSLTSGSSGDESLNNSADEPLRDSGERTKGASKRRKERAALRPLDGQILLSHFPGARNIAFFPLWDTRRENWHAAGFIWTKLARRFFTMEGQMTFLNAMSSTMMAEVSRLSALSSDRAKTDLLGSISHELRSPLHGILGSAELLSSSPHNVFQADLLSTIESCGKTLLDTIEQLLDFSKINHLSQRKRQDTNQHPRYRAAVGAAHGYPATRIDELTEEVVTAVAAGYTAQTQKGTQVAEADRFETRYGHESTPMPDGDEIVGSCTSLEGVALILDIDKSMNMSFHAFPGAWRRIVMNLFANSLKYTKVGHVKVSLSAKLLRTSRNGPMYKIRLTVADSGQGISASYLRDDIFKPFSQENSLASGTGLGLSIVKQIVDSHGGSINVRSIQNVGTKVSVTICMEQAGFEGQDSSGASTALRIEQTLAQRSDGKMACLLGSYSDLESFDGAKNKEVGMETVLRKTCQDWFGLALCTESELESRACDMFFVIEPSTSQLMHYLERMGPLVSRCRPDGRGLLLVICRSFQSRERILLALRETLSVTWIVQCIVQPWGTHKLAKYILRGLDLQSHHETNLSQSQCLKTETVDDEHTNAASSSLHLEHLTMPSSAGAEDPSHERKSSHTNVSPPEGAPNHVYNPFDKKKTPSQRSENEFQARNEAYVQRAGPSSHDAYWTSVTFLLVDDNAINLKILAAFMKRRNAPFSIAQNGLEALETYTSNPAAHRVILMDISMPVMDGLASTRAIRSFEKKEKLRPSTIVIVTGLADARVQEETKASGADAYLAKPVKLQELESRLTDLSSKTSLGPI